MPVRLLTAALVAQKVRRIRTGSSIKVTIAGNRAWLPPGAVTGSQNETPVARRGIAWTRTEPCGGVGLRLRRAGWDPLGAPRQLAALWQADAGK